MAIVVGLDIADTFVVRCHVLAASEWRDAAECLNAGLDLWGCL